MFRKGFLNGFLSLSLLLASLGVAYAPPNSASIPEQDTAQMTAAQKAAAQKTAAQAGEQPTLPPTMPVFAILPTVVNQDVILGNAALFSGMGSPQVASTPSRGGLDHFFAADPQNHNVVDMFDHTGGLFAENVSRAFTETQMDLTTTNAQVCAFLANRQLFPAEVEPQYTDCPSDPPYLVKQINLATVEPAIGRGTNTVIGRLVQVPLAIDIGAAAPMYIPLGGPGGHMSIMLAGGPNTPSLDDSLPGLQAFASPWSRRMRNNTPIGYYPTVSPRVAVQRFESQFPAEMQVNAGTPEMVYYVGFPDVPQDAVMPTWTFPDATAIISGTQVNLKNSTLPGVEGFAPAVQILSPADGAVVLPGVPVTIQFQVTGDFGPFNYTVSAGDQVVASGSMISGTKTLDLGALPPFGDKPEGHMLSVHATNTYLTPGEDAIFLGAASSQYLPAISQNVASGLARPAAVPAPEAPAATMRIGVEWVMNYHNPDSNLSQTKPDAEGLYNYLGGVMGWQRSFNYGNDAAWEKDWRDCSLGGIDCSIGVDRAEFAYFSGHGSSSAWYFGVDRDYGGAWAGNARFQNIRWAAFSSCNTVRGGPYVGSGNPPLTDWFNSFKGSYMVLGFHSVMGDIPFGSQFGFNMDNPLYLVFTWMKPAVREAWVNTAFQMNAGKPAYLYAVGNFNPVNFKLPSAGSGPRPALTGITQYAWVWWDE